MNNYSMNTRGIMCSDCGKKLSNKALASYSLQWQHSGDCYCMVCRHCPDDCRYRICELHRKKLLKNARATLSWFFSSPTNQEIWKDIIARLEDTSITVTATCEHVNTLRLASEKEETFYEHFLMLI